MYRRPIAWYGEEKEGVYKGLGTLFIRGGFETEMIRGMTECLAMGLRVAQVYFGAGSTKPVMAEVLKATKLLDDEYAPVVMVEIETDQVHEIPPYIPDSGPRINVMLTVVVPRIENVFLKKRTDRVLAVGVRYEITDFDDVDGMYKEDVPLLWREIDD